MNFLKKLWFLFLLLPIGVFSQTAAIQNYCITGASQVTTSGSKSSNYVQGVIRQCTVAVYLHGLLAVKSATYTSGGTIAGSTGQTCNATFVGGLTNGTGTIALTGSGIIQSGTAFTIPTQAGIYSSAPTAATLSNEPQPVQVRQLLATMTPALATIYADTNSDTS